MTYVDELANEIQRHVPSRLLPEGDTKPLFRLYALLALTKGQSVSLEDVHNAWAVWMLDNDPEHRSLKPFDALDAETQSSDAPYVKAIQIVAAERLETTPA